MLRSCGGAIRRPNEPYSIFRVTHVNDRDRFSTSMVRYRSTFVSIPPRIMSDYEHHEADRADELLQSRFDTAAVSRSSSSALQ